MKVLLRWGQVWVKIQSKSVSNSVKSGRGLVKFGSRLGQSGVTVRSKLCQGWARCGQGQVKVRSKSGHGLVIAKGVN